MTQCLSCQRIRMRDADEAPPWDGVYRSQFWDLAHAYNTSYLGWLVLISRRHIEALHELSRAEAAELGSLLREVSLALKRENRLPQDLHHAIRRIARAPACAFSHRAAQARAGAGGHRLPRNAPPWRASERALRRSADERAGAGDSGATRVHAPGTALSLPAKDPPDDRA